MTEMTEVFGGAIAVAIIVGVIFLALLAGGIVTIVLGFKNLKGITDGGSAVKPVLLLIGGAVAALLAVVGLIFVVVAAMMLGIVSMAA